MGCTSSNLFQSIFDKYGDQLIKLIIAQKSKEKLDEKYLQATHQLTQKIALFKNKINNLVDSKQTAMKEKFQQLKAQINQKVPGGLSVLQRLKGKSINQISQFDSFQSQIDQIQTKSLKQVDEKHKQFQNQLLDSKNNLRQQIEDQRPKVAIYDQLPQQLRFKIVNQACQKFQQQIGEGKKDKSKKIDQKMNLNELDKILQQINPQNLLQKFAKDSIKKMIQNMTGNKLKGIIDKIF